MRALSRTGKEVYAALWAADHRCTKCGADAGYDHLCAQCRARSPEGIRRTARRNMAARRRRRLKARLCTECGGEPTPGFVTCEACRERRKARHRERVAQWKADPAACNHCGRAAVAGRLYCPACYANQRRQNRNRRIEKRCYGCGVKVPPGRRSRCRDCAAREAASTQARWKARQAAGLCPKCGKHPPEPDRRHCAACLAKVREAQAARRAAGLCGRCGGVLEGKYRTCARCRKLAREWSRRKKAARAA